MWYVVSSIGNQRNREHAVRTVAQSNLEMVCMLAMCSKLLGLIYVHCFEVFRARLRDESFTGYEVA